MDEVEDEVADLALETGDLLDLVLEKLTAWLTGFVEMLPNLVVAVVVVLLFALLGRLAGNLVARASARASQNEQVVSLLRTITRLGTLAVGLFIALGVLQLEKTVTSMLAGIGVVGLALGFAFQDIASNFMSGVIMALREPLRLGDLIETGGILGTVERVTLRATVLRNFSGQLVMIPNKDVLQQPIVNYSQSGRRRIEIDVGVSYDDDLEQAARVAREAVEALDERDADQPVEVIWTGFGSSSVDMRVHFWIDLTDPGADYLNARSRGIVAIRRAFDEHGIEIPFPMRTIIERTEEGAPAGEGS